MEIRDSELSMKDFKTLARISGSLKSAKPDERDSSKDAIEEIIYYREDE